jgi:hypothetical protein
MGHAHAIERFIGGNSGSQAFVFSLYQIGARINACPGAALSDLLLYLE